MKIAFLVYESFTTLDLIGPYEVLHRLPGIESVFVAKEPGEYRVDSKLFGIQVDHALSDVPDPDVFVVPGGSEGTFLAAGDEEILAWVRRAHETSKFSTSVCTGSLILAAAGLLEGCEATTHWAARDLLEAAGAQYVEKRVMRSAERIFTAAGVSAGIDMALTLAAELTDADTARAVQLGIEYDPQPPFDSGSPSRVAPELLDKALSALAGSTS